MTNLTCGHTCVVGLHWGDEGKGKIVDVLTEEFDVVVRYNGGANAGHTVVLDGHKYALHLIPCGVLRPNIIGVIAPGVVVDPAVLLAEISQLRDRGVEIAERLLISDRAHVVMPYHKKQDLLSEAALSDERKIGTTARGIGPCYSDKMQRSTAIRIGDLLHPDRLRERIAHIVCDKNKIFQALYGDDEPLCADAVYAEYADYAKRLAPFVTDTTPLLHAKMREGKRILFEGGHGTLLDIDHGTFPYVSSSSASAVGVSAGAGVPGSAIKDVIGITKAYTTRVGTGPFPTELDDEIGRKIRDKGNEYGTTTGRPRRCGWFDSVAARYAVMLGGITQVAVMHLDTLCGFDQVGICTGYEHDGKELPGFVADAGVLEEVTPIIQTMPGWDADLSEVTSFDALPAEAKRYLDRVEQLLDAPVTIVSVGPDRRQTLVRDRPVRRC